MLEVTVKTLDGQNRSFTVPENITVKEFKEKIASSISISADTQRLIFQGRVLHDEKLLQEYDVHGKVVHVVLRPPPAPGRPARSDNAQPSSVPPGRDVNSVVVGSFTLPSDVIDTHMVQSIAQDAIRSMGDLGRNARVSTRTSTDGSAVDVHIHLGPSQSGTTTSEAQNRLNTARRMIRIANETLDQLENPDRERSRSDSPMASSAPTTEPVTESTSTRQEPVDSTTGSQPVSPMETSETEEAEVSSQTGGASQEAGTSANQSTEQSTTDQSASSSGQNDNQPPRMIRPNISALGEILTDVLSLNTRLQPHIERFAAIVREDAEMDQATQTENQRICDMVSEAMHAVSHSHHAISDLMVNLSQNRPRQLFVTLAIAQPHTAVIQQTIPVQTRVHVRGSPRSNRGRSAERVTQNSTHTTNIPSVAVPSSDPAATSSSTVTTGTSTGPQPSTTETGTQSNGAPGTQPSTSTFGAQHNAGIAEEDIQRIQQQMTAGLQGFLGQGLQQGDGSPDNPFVFVEMGPDSMSVNSISAEIVTHDANDPTHTTGSTSSSTSTPQSTQSTATSSSNTPPTTAGQAPQGQGMSPDWVRNLIQQVITSPGAPGQRMQINLGRGGQPSGVPGMMGFPGPGGPSMIRLGFGTNPRPGAPRNESGTQTSTATGIPSNSGTQTTTTTTSATSTQTASATSSTAGSQTPGGGRTSAFYLPGMPGLAQNIRPADPYLPCSSRHFLTQYAQGVLNQNNGQNNETDLANMVSNLMSGLMGGTSGAPASGTDTPSTATGTSTSSSTPTPPRFPGFDLPGVAGIRIGGRGPMTSMQLGPGARMMGGNLPPFLQGMPGMRFRFSGPPRPGTAPGAPTTTPGAQRPTGPARHPAQGTTPTSGSDSGTPPSGEPQFVQALRSMLQASNLANQGNQSNSSSSSSTTSSGTQSTTQSGQQGTSGQSLSDEDFTQLVSGITGFMSQAAVGQAPRQTIADFLSGLGSNYNVPQGEGFINDVMSCILSNLQVTDLISVFYGSPSPLNQVHIPLREFISERVLNGCLPTPAAIRLAVEDLMEGMQTEIQEAASTSHPRPNINFVATLNHFISQQFYNIISLIMNTKVGDNNFGIDLYSCVRRMLSECIILCSRCLGGIQNVETLVTQRMRALTAGANPFIQNWMASTTSQQLSTFIPTIVITEGEIAHYIVYKEVWQSASAATGTSASSSSKPRADSNPQKPTSSTATAKSSAASAATSPAATGASGKRDSSPLRAPSPKRTNSAKEEMARKSDTQPMETSPISTTSPGASEIEIDTQRKSPATEIKGSAAADSSSSSKPRTLVRNDVSSPVGTPSPAGAQSVNGDWQSVIPAEWVPVINGDIEKQRNQPAQHPHSDVYLQGLPPKRRRLMTQDRPGDLSSPADVLPNSLRRAVAAAAVEPISSLDNLSSEVTTNTELQEAFQSQITSTITERLESDNDFKPERFPNSEDYFHKSTDNKK